MIDTQQYKDFEEQLRALAAQADYLQAGLDLEGIHTPNLRHVNLMLTKLATTAGLAARAAELGKSLSAADIQQWARERGLRSEVR